MDSIRNSNTAFFRIIKNKQYIKDLAYAIFSILSTYDKIIKQYTHKPQPTILNLLKPLKIVS